MSSHFYDSWARIDQSDDPDFFLATLDASRASTLAAADRDPTRYFAWLDPFHAMSLLEIGCGPGNLTQILAELAGSDATIVGLDLSSYMISEARSRASPATSVKFVVGDAHGLPFPDDCFDRTLANVTLQHLVDPALALREMIRVTRPGGLVAVADQDWETLIVDADDAHLTRRLTQAFTNGIRHGRMGRRLFAMLRSAGLYDVTVLPESTVYRSFAATRVYIWDQVAQIGVDSGAATASEVEQWLGDLAERDRAGLFFASCTSFRMVGRKPGRDQDQLC